MTEVPWLPPQAALRQAGLRAKKSWGQNFLCDVAVLKTIAEAAVQASPRHVVELGAGLGALTYHLLRAGAQVTAIERDRELVPALKNYLGSSPALVVKEADAARLDYAALAAEQGGPLTVVGNLPYQLSSRILVSLAESYGTVARAALLVQREVAQRLQASPPGRDYGLLSVLVQRAFSARILCHVPPTAFHPAPKVHSAVVLLEARDTTRSAQEDLWMVSAARAAFSARRKTLRNALAGACGQAGAAAERLIAGAGLAPGARAETLDLDAFARLGAAMAFEGWLEEAS